MISSNDIYEWYENRILQSIMDMPSWRPWEKEDSEQIINMAKASLGVKDEFIPKIEVKRMKSKTFPGGMCDFLSFSSWPGVVGAAHLYRPETETNKPLPLIILCCGHEAGSKHEPAYQLMARHLCRLGALVLVPDNIGQGERRAMGHNKESIAPFAQGASLQGLIVMETMAWIRWALKSPSVDSSRIAAIGNSGGGTLTMFLAAFCPELAAVSSSGYPSSFEFVARKEKAHCACNLLPGFLGRFEMWHLLGCFAPKPLLIFQGINDQLFPVDVFQSTARKVQHVYSEVGAPTKCHCQRLEGKHAWNSSSRELVAEFFCKYLKLSPVSANEGEGLLRSDERCLSIWPKNALKTDDILPSLKKSRAEKPDNLWSIYPPQLPEDYMAGFWASSDADKRVFAQYECFMAAIG